MDQSVVRRGAPTVHKAIEAAALKSGQKERASHYGISQAILLGDLALAWASEVFDQSVNSLVEATPDRFGTLETSGIEAQRPRQLFHQMLQDLIWGQQLDMLASAQHDLDRILNETILRYKSGMYTIVRPLQIGALFAGVAPDLVRHLEPIGVNLGAAFQIHDDRLGLIGNERDLGKSARSDLYERKITFPILEAAAVSKSVKTQIQRWFEKPTLTETEVNQLLKILKDPVILQRVDQAIQERISSAKQGIQQLPLPEKDRQFLCAFGEYLVKRET
jgi:geranylgeranyl diphosphate synthase type I